jgi:hypothetical protein
VEAEHKCAIVITFVGDGAPPSLHYISIFCITEEAEVVESIHLHMGGAHHDVA